MPPSIPALQKIAESANVPGLAYAYVAPGSPDTSLTVGQKNAASTDADMNAVDDRTRFPASSLSKIVFTYLVLQLFKAGKIGLDEHLHNILPYERFKVQGKYPKKATQLTARQILSHSTGLPNLGSNLSAPLTFAANSKLGEGYSYSGEALLYLQKVIEKKMGKSLEALAQQYVFGPLGMERSTFAAQPADDPNVVTVHTELGKPMPIYVDDSFPNAAGSLLTTAADFSKFMAAWLVDDPFLQQAFEPAHASNKCGLGWHIYRDPTTKETFAYQFGENPNTRAFVAINLTTQKAAAFFTNSENGMSIANQVLSSPDLAPIGNLQPVLKGLHYNQSDEPGWRATLDGKIAEEHDNFDEARHYFVAALALAPTDESKHRRLEWFDAMHSAASEKQTFTQPLEAFIGKLKNRYNDQIDLSIKDGGLIYKEFDREIKLVRISETDFLPEKDQSFRVHFINNEQVSIGYVHGGQDKFLERTLPKSQETTSLDVADLNSAGGNRRTHKFHTERNKVATTPAATHIVADTTRAGNSDDPAAACPLKK